jgi:hypothetical protein
MKKEEMTRIVNDELERLPRTSEWDAQAELRLVYNALRRQDLKLRRNREQTLARCIEHVKKEHPFWTPEYDRGYFRL